MLRLFLARELHMREVGGAILRACSSALGEIIADVKSDFIETVYADLRPERTQFAAAFTLALEKRAIRWLPGTIQEPSRRPRSPALGRDAYRGQSFEIETPLDAAPCSGDGSGAGEAFHAEHERYGHADRDAAIRS